MVYTKDYAHVTDTGEFDMDEEWWNDRKQVNLIFISDRLYLYYNIR